MPEARGAEGLVELLTVSDVHERVQGESKRLSYRPEVEDEILALDVVELTQALAEGDNEVGLKRS